MQNPPRRRDTLVFINKGPYSYSETMLVEIPVSEKFCKGGMDLTVTTVTKQMRPPPASKMNETFDNFVPMLNNGLYFNEIGEMHVNKKVDFVKLAAVNGMYNIEVKALTVLMLHCFYGDQFD